ncbi:hypothetical protein ACL02U_09980 [Streptomyces sp. MS06]|uniref:hypothetical protein n=1 Tax=Streptomyces sp. MS06 TaxID=3385974 RepID=UPI0039A357C5
MAASAHLLLSALSKPGAEPTALPRQATEPTAVPRQAVEPTAEPDAPQRYLFSSESPSAEMPLTSEPPLPDSEPLTSEPPLSDTTPLTSESDYDSDHDYAYCGTRS